MERLTYWNKDLECWSYHGPSGEAAIRLAAYEDTGLEPEEVLKKREEDNEEEDNEDESIRSLGRQEPGT